VTGNRYLGLAVQGIEPALFSPRPEWFDEARCRGVGQDLFFPDQGDVYAARDAKAICAGCPVRRLCLDHALANGEHWGVWGGTNERERRKLRRAS
jgi:WhiB family redox-sensing transcriptional regulator